MLSNLKNNIQERCYDAKAYSLLVTAATLTSLKPHLCHIRKFEKKKKSDLTDAGHDA